MQLHWGETFFPCNSLRSEALSVETSAGGLGSGQPYSLLQAIRPFGHHGAGRYTHLGITFTLSTPHKHEKLAQLNFCASYTLPVSISALPEYSTDSKPKS